MEKVWKRYGILSVAFGGTPEYRPVCHLRSYNKMLLHDPGYKMVNYGKRAFGHAAPYLWNDIPENMRIMKSKSEFKSSLKTHLYRLAFK